MSTAVVKFSALAAPNTQSVIGDAISLIGEIRKAISNKDFSSFGALAARIAKLMGQTELGDSLNTILIQMGASPRNPQAIGLAITDLQRIVIMTWVPTTLASDGGGGGQASPIFTVAAPAPMASAEQGLEHIENQLRALQNVSATSANANDDVEIDPKTGLPITIIFGAISLAIQLFQTFWRKHATPKS